MANNELKLDIKGLETGFKKAWRRVPTVAGAKATTFFKQNFRRGGWPENGQLKRWKPRVDGSKKRALLIKSGRLRNDIRVLSKSETAVQIGTTLPYAQAHNEGAVISKSVTVSGHTRAAHRRKGHLKTIAGRRRRVKPQTVRQTDVATHNRQMNTRIPKRQFIGESSDVLKSVEREVFRDIDRIIANLK